MFTIHTYTDTECELEIAKSRLDFLIDKKTRLYRKYFPLSSEVKEIIVDGGEKNNDKMADYLHELHEIDYGTGKSLEEEIIYQQEIVDKLKNYLDIMSNSLSKTKGLEYQLFYEIVYNGVNITKAVENISSNYNADVSTVWRVYKRIKKYVKKLKMPVF